MHYMNHQLENIGEWISSFNKRKIQFSVGGSGVEAALGKYWNKMKVLKPKQNGETFKSKTITGITRSCRQLLRNKFNMP